jgi:hypothetical protein
MLRLNGGARPAEHAALLTAAFHWEGERRKWREKAESRPLACSAEYLMLGAEAGS